MMVYDKVYVGRSVGLPTHKTGADGHLQVCPVYSTFLAKGHDARRSYPTSPVRLPSHQLASLGVVPPRSRRCNIWGLDSARCSATSTDPLAWGSVPRSNDCTEMPTGMQPLMLLQMQLGVA